MFFQKQFQGFRTEIIITKRMFLKLVKALCEKILPKAQDLEDILNLNLKMVVYSDTESDTESDDDNYKHKRLYSGIFDERDYEIGRASCRERV
jgi:hypothetical protein